MFSVVFWRLEAGFREARKGAWRAPKVKDSEADVSSVLLSDLVRQGQRFGSRLIAFYPA